MFSLYHNPNSYANLNCNPAVSDCYIQVCGLQTTTVVGLVW